MSLRLPPGMFIAATYLPVVCVCVCVCVCIGGADGHDHRIKNIFAGAPLTTHLVLTICFMSPMGFSSA
jgi:hypothetical protein